MSIAPPLLATWQAKVPWKEILLLLAAAMSTLRHVEVKDPRLLRLQLKPHAARRAAPHRVTRHSTPRDADLVDLTYNAVQEETRL